MSELEYRAAKTAAAKEEVLHRLKDVVLSTATFLADFPERRIGTGTNGAYLDIGPPLVSAAEGEGPYDVWNPRSVNWHRSMSGHACKMLCHARWLGSASQVLLAVLRLLMVLSCRLCFEHLAVTS